MDQTKKKKVKNAIQVFLIIIFAISIPMLLCLYAFQAKRYTDLTKEIKELEAKQERLIEDNKKLVGEISILSSAERIEQIAVEELGMHKAESDDIIRVEMTGEKK
ncbi:MAG: cell division protein FtsL [Treponema sp.]|nr:cell division protein FtsL [Treponema sp.]